MSTSGSAGPEVRVSTGRLRGRMEDGVAVFRGIPFGRPPVGDLRLAAPVPAEPWDGVREAVAFGAPPPQSRLLGTSGADGGDGDWLTVNVWSADLGAARLPVMVWIQGGGYMYGRSGDPLFDGRVLARDGVVLVTFNYRVSAEGFGHFHGAPANRGFLDQVAALRWVHDNIAAFGGDPGRVTVFGESAGAGSIAALMAMPAAAGLFRGAIAQSVPGVFFSAELAADLAVAVAGELGLPPVAGQLARLSPERLLDAGDAVADKMAGRSRWGRAAFVQMPFAPVVDGEVLPATPWQALSDGAAPGVELIAGHTRDEYRLFMAIKGELGQVTGEQADAALRELAPDPPAYRAAFPEADAELLYELVHSDWLFRMPSARLAEARGRHGRAYLYELTWPAPGMGGELLGACHGLGLPLTFGNLTAGAAGLLIGREPPAVAAELSARVRAAWVAFAAVGDPGWPAYEPRGGQSWIIGAEAGVAVYPEERSRGLWAGHAFEALPLQ
ncbi:carboxylesterase/lipase family protein [Nonomuraea gerenzanensis]|uniref:Carboxylic ester hydrolase n=1 Tax=Nonomuraea gerenzanensis TaxID=93944 RepID=A0A1M4EEL7_9ACTN|nr:carboxylesterase family protein [Nonomuraea gerenzanensis]UBU08662.1 carboxylesterase family protein [Nonomuraea gerenzanensis]SBO97023.1 putative carboxylesterase [Nonomuraea gerenzanensis]